MIIQCEAKLTGEQYQKIQSELEQFGCQVTEVITQLGHYFVALAESDIDIRRIGHLEGVRDVHRVSDSYKLVSRKWKVEPTSIDLGDGVFIRSGELSIMAGPCSIESEEQVRAVASHLKENGVSIMRGGVYKPRTSPYSFRGVGLDGLKMWSRCAKEFGLKIISEVLAAEQIEGMMPYVDIFQVGARNAQNFSLLHELGQVDKPVLIKRGMSSTIEELLQSAEYVFSSGNEKLMLCERGIRTFERSYRNTLDLNSVPVLKEKSHLPVIVDPSHGIGVRRFVEPMALAGVIAGCDGLLVEISPKPENALSDGDQTLNFRESGSLIQKAKTVLELRESHESC